MARNSIRYFVMSVAAAGGLLACGNQVQVSEPKTPHLTQEEALVDLHAMVAKIKSLYGPLEFKEERFGFKLETLVHEAEQAIKTAKNDHETLGALTRLLMKFRDGHVSVRFPVNGSGVFKYHLGAFIIPVEQRAIVGQVEPSLAEQGVEVGDELLTIDGEKPFDLLPTVLKYHALGNEVSDQHAIYQVLDRKFYMTELVPTRPVANLIFAKKDGSKLEVNAAWEKIKEATSKVDLVGGLDQFYFAQAQEMSELSEGGLTQMGQYKSFFATDEVKGKFNLIEVTPNDDYLKKYEVTLDQLKDSKGMAIYAALMKDPETKKTILLVRQPGYYPSELEAKNLVKGYRAILDQFDDIADVLVVDQTHNPGGSLQYAHDFFRLFVQKPAVNLVQHMNVDRLWISGLHEWANELEKDEPGLAKAMRVRAQLIDQALDEGRSITEPMSLVGFDYVKPDEKYTWKKPILVLADELAGSCGDIFPMYMKRNNIAKIFGERTMGLGGNVEEVIKLPYSGASVRMTRGLFTTYRPDQNYQVDELVENNGIQPDFKYTHTVDDVRAGYIDYVGRFVSEAAKLAK